MHSDLDQQLKAYQTSGVTGRQLIEKTGDVQLGSTTLPLVALLSNRTGTDVHRFKVQLIS